MADRNIDAFAARLSDPQAGTVTSCSALVEDLKADNVIDVKQKLNNATELRDNIDLLCSGPSYAVFLKKLIPVFAKLLEGPPVFISTSWEQVCSLSAFSPGTLTD